MQNLSVCASARRDRNLLLSFIFNNHVESSRIILPNEVTLRDVDFDRIEDVLSLLALLTDDNERIDLTPYVKKSVKSTNMRSSVSTGKVSMFVLLIFNSLLADGVEFELIDTTQSNESEQSEMDSSIASTSMNEKEDPVLFEFTFILLLIYAFNKLR